MCALPYCEWKEVMLKISFIHRLFLELTNCAVCPTYSVRAEVTAMIRETPFSDGLRPVLAYVNNRPERTAGWPERWMIHRPDRACALYLVNQQIPSAGNFQPSLTRIPELTVPHVVTTFTSPHPVNKGGRILEWRQQ